MAIGLQIGALVIWSSAGFAPPGYVFMRGPIPLITLEVSLAAQAAAAAILALRRPDHPLGWYGLGFAIVGSLAAPMISATAGVQSATPTAAQAWLGWLCTSLVFPASTFLSIVLAFVFPDGRLISRRWGLGLALVGGTAIAAAFALAVRPGTLLFFPTIPNPAVGDGGFGGTGLVPVGLGLLALSGSAAGMATLYRYRESDAIIRLQIRWFSAGSFLVAIGFVAMVIALLTLPPFDPLGEFIETGFYLVVGIPPIAIAIAILRYRLYDIDVIISRAFVYGALTAVLAGTYTASIRLFNAMFTVVTGETSDLALVLTTLLLATTFTPIKSRLEGLVAGRLGPEVEPVPGGAVAAVLDDPAFDRMLTERIQQSLRELDPPIGAAASSSRTNPSAPGNVID